MNDHKSKELTHEENNVSILERQKAFVIGSVRRLEDAYHTISISKFVADMQTKAVGECSEYIDLGMKDWPEDNKGLLYQSFILSRGICIGLNFELRSLYKDLFSIHERIEKSYARSNKEFDLLLKDLKKAEECISNVEQLTKEQGMGKDLHEYVEEIMAQEIQQQIDLQTKAKIELLNEHIMSNRKDPLVTTETLELKKGATIEVRVTYTPSPVE